MLLSGQEVVVAHFAGKEGLGIEAERVFKHGAAGSDADGEARNLFRSGWLGDLKTDRAQAFLDARRQCPRANGSG